MAELRTRGSGAGTAEPTAEAAGSRLISATAVMAAGTMASRVLGFVRIALLSFALGNATPQVDTFNIANGIPNMLYILLAGGVLNTVFVPQIVRAMKNDPDGGEAYTNRLVTVGLLGLALITTAATLLAPAIMWLYTDGRWKLPVNAGHFDNIVVLAYLCLPQIFFYGVNVLLGQVLNSRGVFGPMAWSPLANNVVAVLVLVGYVVVWPPLRGLQDQPFTLEQLLVLGLGATAGIVLQAAVLIPFMRRAGFRYRPRFDFRGVGLGRTASLAKWTLGYVVVTQVAVWVVTRLASGATLAPAGPGDPGGEHGAGLTVYNNAYLLWILPHSLITVSLATAMLPSASRRAAAGDLAGAGQEAMRALRLATTVIVPAAVAFLALAFPISDLLFGNGSGAGDWRLIAWTLTAFAVGLVPFTCQYLCLRGFYALEDTRTPFFIQLVIGAVNIVLALLFVLPVGRPDAIAVGLALAYALSYVVGLGVSFRLLRRRLPVLDGAALVRHCVRLAVAVAPAGLLAAGICALVGLWSQALPARALALVLAGVAALATFALTARLLHIAEVLQLARQLGGRLPGPARRLALAYAGPAARSAVVPGAGEVTDPHRSGDSSGEWTARSGTIGDDEAAATSRHAGAGGPLAGGPGSIAAPYDPTGSVPTLEGLAAAESSIDTHVGDSGHSGSGHTMASSPTRTPDGATLDRSDDPADTSVPGPATDPAVTDAGSAATPTVEHPATLEPPAPGADVPEDLHLPPGTVLGRRYRLEELLVSAQPAVTWRAFDQVLSRSVLVHLLPVGDARAPRLLDAARRAAIATDSRFLRVLDAVDVTEQPSAGVAGQTAGEPGSIGSYIVCEYATGQSLQTLLAGSPLTGLEAGWLLREIADAIAGVHALGLHHRRINPDTVIITPAGNVKIVGLLIEAVLRSHPGQADEPDPEANGAREEAADVRDLGRLLYACLVGRWPGGPAFGLPAAPHTRDGGSDTPEPVATDPDATQPFAAVGVSGRPVDEGAVGAEDHRWLTPRQVRHGVSPALDRICDQLLSPHPRHRVPPIATAAQLVDELSRVLGPADASGDLERRLRHPGGSTADATPPGVPRSAFLDSAGTSWSPRSPRSPGRRTASAVSPSARVHAPVAGLTTAPVGRATRPTEPPRTSGRRHPRRWIALLIALALIAVLAVAIGTALTRGPGTSATGPSSSRPSTTPSAAAAPKTVPIVAARDFDPTAQGGNGTENPSQVPLAYDGNPKTRWTTLTYYGSPKLGRLKDGVGLVLDLGAPVPVRDVTLQLSGDGTNVQLRVPQNASDAPVMNTDRAWRTVASVSGAGAQATLTPAQPVTSRYVLVYLTSLPKEGNGYRGGIYEVEVQQ